MLLCYVTLHLHYDVCIMFNYILLCYVKLHNVILRYTVLDYVTL